MGIGVEGVVEREKGREKEKKRQRQRNRDRDLNCPFISKPFTMFFLYNLCRVAFAHL